MRTSSLFRGLFITLGVFVVGCAVGTEDPGLEGAAVVPAPSSDPKTPAKAVTDTAPAEPAPPKCPTINACIDATDVGTFSGDTGQDSKSAQGHGSQWLKVRMSEDSHGLGGSAMSLTATLTSPPGVNYDLYVYVPDFDIFTCSGVTASSTNAGTTDTATHTWGETGLLGNDSDDDRWVTIEVRHVSGTCSPSATWSLQLTR